MPRKILFVSFSVDLGSATLQKNFLQMLEGRCDVIHAVFSPDEHPRHGMQLSSARRAMFRLGEMKKLRELCALARAQGRAVIFQQISPALFALPFLKGVDSYIFLDWTRKLYEPIIGKSTSSVSTTRLHRLALNRVTGVLAFTGPAEQSLRHDYRVPAARIHRMPMPFDVHGTDVARTHKGRPLQMVFVGGDFYRKGGDAVVRWYEANKSAAVDLTVVTQTDVRLPEGVRLIRNEPDHSAKSVLADFDLFVLPTHCDAYPLAIGEAASAGLCVVTTKNALGAEEIIDPGRNGYIVASEQELFERLSRLLNDRERCESMKAASREKMQAGFAYDLVQKRLDAILEETQSFAHGGQVSP